MRAIRTASACVALLPEPTQRGHIVCVRERLTNVCPAGAVEAEVSGARIDPDARVPIGRGRIAFIVIDCGSELTSNAKLRWTTQTRSWPEFCRAERVDAEWNRRDILG